MSPTQLSNRPGCWLPPVSTFDFPLFSPSFGSPVFRLRIPSSMIEEFHGSVVWQTSSAFAALIKDFKLCGVFSRLLLFFLPSIFDLTALLFSAIDQRGYTMLTTCSLLGEQAERLRDLYDMQHRLISRDGSASELRAVEFDLIQMHRIIKRHRIRCSECKLNDRFAFPMRSDMRLRPLPSEAPSLSVQVY
jgi:hypothetical protein